MASPHAKQSRVLLGTPPRIRAEVSELPMPALLFSKSATRRSSTFPVRITGPEAY